MTEHESRFGSVGAECDVCGRGIPVGATFWCVPTGGIEGKVQVVQFKCAQCYEESKR